MKSFSLSQEVYLLPTYLEKFQSSNAYAFVALAFVSEDLFPRPVQPRFFIDLTANKPFRFFFPPTHPFSPRWPMLGSLGVSDIQGWIRLKDTQRFTPVFCKDINHSIDGRQLLFVVQFKLVYLRLERCSYIEDTGPIHEQRARTKGEQLFWFLVLWNTWIHARSHDPEEGVISEHGSYGTTVAQYCPPISPFYCATYTVRTLRLFDVQCTPILLFSRWDLEYWSRHLINYTW